MRITNDHYLIVDLEATCSNDGSVPPQEMEIIEIGAVMQNARTFEIEDEFQTFIRPVRHTQLTPFCTELTTITQRQVDEAPSFAEAFMAFTTWCDRYPDALFCSWGNYDRKQIQQDCSLHQFPYPFAGHMNIKTEFAKAQGLQKGIGLGYAIKKLGLEFAGVAHRGIDDARNIARVVRQVCLGS